MGEWRNYIDEMICRYLRDFAVLAETVRGFGTNIKVGGGGFSLRFGKEQFEELIRRWAKIDQRPSFISMYIYPYARKNSDMCLNNHVMRDGYMKSCLEFAAEVMAREGLNVRLTVTEWNCTVFNRNIINDTVYKGAWIVKNVLECMNLADVLAYWTGSDLYAEYIDQTPCLSGSVGLLTREGIRKPAWYAINFLNCLERFICKKTENVIVTRGKYHNYRILCHHYKSPDYRYYLKREDEISPEEAEVFFSGGRHSLRLYFELPVLFQNTYRLKFLRVNKNSGSVLDEWIAMSVPQYMDSEDTAYLKMRCTPHMTVRTYKENNGKIAFTTILEPNEIQLIFVECQGRI